MLGFGEAFRLATRGGGEFFGRVGAFESGFEADAVILDDTSVRTTLKNTLSLSERLEQYAYLKGRESVTAKYVKGKRLVL